MSFAATVVHHVPHSRDPGGWGNVTESLKMGFFMLWETLWALILGFGLSGAVQAFVSKDDMQRVMGDHRPATVARASFFGMVSSSCSYAATAMAKSLFQKGADFVTAMVFMFASTNLVVELGVVLLILMGWQFAAAEFVGGPVMIVLFAAIGGYLFHRRVTDPARQRLQQGVVGGHDHQAMVGVGHDRQAELEAQPWRQKLTSKAAWSDAASYTMADITMLRKELAFGYLVAGVLTVVVPMGAWNDLFLHGHGFWTVLENAALGPVIAFVSFVCSIGNVPLAAALWAGGISFAGVISFIFADLVTFPLFLIYRKYYGTRLAVRLALTFWAVMSVAGLTVEGLFSVLGIIPAQSNHEVVHTRFEWNYTTYLNFVFLVVFAGLYWLHRNRARFGGGEGYALDPVCGMQVRTSDAPARTTRDGTTIYFCSDRCLDRFQRDPQRYLDSPAAASHAHHHEEDPMAIDPVCGMTVDPTDAPATRRHADRNWFFCNPGCADTFDTDPDRYVAQALGVEGD
ncbi:MAG: permease [Acidobacteria bacterium]|nr:permease [Acidobacteriota bacterium]